MKLFKTFIWLAFCIWLAVSAGITLVMLPVWLISTAIFLLEPNNKVI